MSIEDLVLTLMALFLAVVAIGTALLAIVGFSPGKGALITVTFMFTGIWNPIGWIVLGLCIWLQVKENRARMLACRAAPQMPSTAETRITVGPATTAATARQQALGRGDSNQRR